VKMRPSPRGAWIVLLALLSLQPLRTDAATPLEGAIRNAAELQILGQRLVVLYCQLGQDVNFMSAKEQLGQTVRSFEAEFDALQRFTDTPIADQLSGIAEIWQGMKETALGEVSQAEAKQLDHNADRLLQASGDLLQTLIKGADSPAVRKIDRIDHQRLLTNRMSKGYLLMSWGVDAERYRKDYEQAVSDFEEGMIELETATDNSPGVAEQLKQTAKKWNTFRYSNKIDPDRYYPGLVVKMLEKIDEMLLNTVLRYIATS